MRPLAQRVRELVEPNLIVTDRPGATLEGLTARFESLADLENELISLVDHVRQAQVALVEKASSLVDEVA